ncbi:MAG: polysaccharide deacetylase family protein [Bacilli bacterium]|nr:polysaccharide deacetylase family protein [Bacilli bacterium]
MKYKNISIAKIIFIPILPALFIVSILFFIDYHTKTDYKGSSNTPTSEKASGKKPKPSLNISKIIQNIKNQNSALTLEYETHNIKEFTSLVYLNKEDVKDINHQYKSIIIDTATGKEINFIDLIKTNKQKEFTLKEIELLRLKYPEFIVNNIISNKNGKGFKFYYVKDNEVIVFYYDYDFGYNYSEQVSLIINYNEIKDFLSFTPVLDSTYENVNGFNYDPNKKSVAITFDDGPSSTYNSRILEELAKNKAHATFFMVGKMMNSCSKCVIDTYKSGNEVASHTYEHMNIKKTDTFKVNESLTKVDDIYYNLTKDHIKYLRPPYGAYSKENLENVTVPFILWNLDTEDWRYRNVDHIVNYIMDNVSDGSIILMHELYETSYESLKIVLPKLYAMGYQVVSVGELSHLKGKTLEVGKAYVSLK